MTFSIHPRSTHEALSGKLFEYYCSLYFLPCSSCCVVLYRFTFLLACDLNSVVYGIDSPCCWKLCSSRGRKGIPWDGTSYCMFTRMLLYASSRVYRAVARSCGCLSSFWGSTAKRCGCTIETSARYRIPVSFGWLKRGHDFVLAVLYHSQFDFSAAAASSRATFCSGRRHS